MNTKPSPPVNPAKAFLFIVFLWAVVIAIVSLVFSNCSKNYTVDPSPPNDLTQTDISHWLTRFENEFDPDSTARKGEVKNFRAVNFYTHHKDTIEVNIIYTIHQLSGEATIEYFGEPTLFISLSPDLVKESYLTGEVETTFQVIRFSRSVNYFKVHTKYKEK